ncbi:MAG: PAS domain S-box protein [Alphaproteobacteria bacterium]|nr:PAS domain S-box protein [Alphaproteobacteria bacterium]
MSKRSRSPSRHARKTKAQLIQELSSLEDAVDSIPEALVAFDAEDRVAYYNSAYEELFPSIAPVLRPGLAYRDLLRAQLGVVPFEDAAGREDEWIEERIARRRNPGAVSEQRFSDGRIMQLAQYKTAIGGTVDVRRNISELRQSQSVEILQQNRLEALMNAVPIPMFFKDSEGRYLSCNSAYERLVGLSESEIVGKRIGDFTTPERAAAHEVADAALFANHGSDVYEHTVMAASGIPRRIIFYKTVFGGEGKNSPPTMVGVLVDITEIRVAERALRQSEERWSTVFQENPIAMALTDPENRKILEVNDAWCTAWGHKREDAIGKTTSDLALLKTDELRGKFFESMAEHGHVDKFELTFITKDGRERIVQITAQTVMLDGIERILSFVDDVTEQKAAQLALGRSEAQFRNLIERSIQGIIVHVDYQLVFANEAAARMFGYDNVAEFLAQGSYDNLIAEVDRQRLREFKEQRLKGGSPPDTYEFQGLRKDGAPIWIENQATVVDWQGQQAVQSLTVDITNRKQAEQALAESERQFRNLFEGSSQGITIHVDGQIEFSNERAAQIFGYANVAEFLALDDFGELIAAEDRERLLGYAASRLVGTTPPNIYDFRGLRKDGTKVWLENRITGISWQGRQAFLVFTVDISERKTAAAAVERFIDALEFVPQGFALWNAESRLIYSNGQFRDFLGPVGATLAPGAKHADVVKEFVAQGAIDDAVGHEDDWLSNRFQELEQPSSMKRFRHLGRWHQGSTQRLPDGSMIVQTADIHDLTTAEEQLRQSQKMEAVGQLTGGIAHDFNNLLAVTLGHLELAADGLSENDSTLPLLEKAIAATNRGADLVHRLLAFSSKQTLSPEIFDLNEHLHVAAEMLHRVLDESIEIKISAAVEPLFCKADIGQMETALLNLAINARDAMVSGGTLTIAVGAAGFDEAEGDIDAGDYVTLTISDTGDGMSETILSRVFEPFFTTKEQGKGTGLGLSMVYGFVKQSAGHITVQSEPEAGTTFTIYLPRHKGLDRAGDGPVPSQSVTEASESILLVEDDPDLLELASQILQSLGYQVYEACDGPAAFEFLASRPRIDLLLTDVVLPKGHSGPDIAARARATWPDIRVLYMSGYNDHPALDGHDSDENLALIAKPFRKAQLAAKVRAVLGHGE